MIRCRLYVILDRGWAERWVWLSAVPRVGDYVLLPGHGELGAKVYSVIFADGQDVTLQFRNVTRDDVALLAGAWRVMP